jgi:hypothetical protein
MREIRELKELKVRLGSWIKLLPQSRSQTEFGNEIAKQVIEFPFLSSLSSFFSVSVDEHS